MGKPNRKHREAKRRAKEGRVDFWAARADHDRPPTALEIAAALFTAAVESNRGGSRAVADFVAELAGDESLRAEVEQGAQLAGARLLGLAYEGGWLPGDIHQGARRRVGNFAVSLLIDLMAAHIRPFARDTVDETWLAQLDELATAVWWSDTTSYLGQWSAEHMLTTEESLAAVVELLALLVQLPRLELIRPLPGTARAQVRIPHHVDEKVLTRVRGLLAKAESTSFPDEAEALSAKAQELMTKYALDRVLVDADTAVPDLPGARRIWLDTPYVDAKALLVDVVAGANRARAIFLAEWGFVTVVGDDTDLDAVELLSTSLLVQATRAMIASGDPATRGDEARSRDYRKAFLVSYATRIGERLAAATAATIAESAEPQRLLPVLASRQLAVDTAFDTLFPTARSRGIVIRSAEGWDAGRAAADRARLDSRRSLDT